MRARAGDERGVRFLDPLLWFVLFMAWVARLRSGQWCASGFGARRAGSGRSCCWACAVLVLRYIAVFGVYWLVYGATRVSKARSMKSRVERCRLGDRGATVTVAATAPAYAGVGLRGHWTAKREVPRPRRTCGIENGGPPDHWA